MTFEICKCCTVCTFDQLYSSNFWELQIFSKKIKGHCVDNGRGVQLVIDLTRMILMVLFSRRAEWFEVFHILDNYLYLDIKSCWNCNQKYKMRISVLRGLCSFVVDQTDCFINPYYSNFLKVFLFQDLLTNEN